MADAPDYWARAEIATAELLRLLRQPERNRPNFNDYWFEVGLATGRVERAVRELASEEAGRH